MKARQKKPDQSPPDQPAPAQRGIWSQLTGRGFRRRSSRVGILVLLVVIVAIVGGFVFLLTGPADIGALRDRIKSTIETNVGGGYQVDVGRSALSLDPVLGLIVEVDDITVRDPTTEIAADIPSTRLSIDLWGLFGTRGLVRAVEVDGATFLFSRSDDGRVQLGAPRGADATEVSARDAAPPAAVPPAAGNAADNNTGGEQAGGFPDLFAALQILDRGIEPAIATAVRSGFARFAMTNSTISVKDSRESLPRLFLRTDLSAVVHPSTKQVAINFATSGFSGRWTANAERSVDAQSGERTLTATFSQLTLADLFPVFGRENTTVSSDVPLYGRSTVRLTPDGAVTEATLRLDAGAGIIRFRTEEDFIQLDEATVRLRWDVANNALVVEPSTILAGRTQALIGGTIRPLGEAKDRRYAFDLESRGAILAPRDSPEPPLSTERIAVSGTADLPAKLVTVDSATIVSRVASVSAAGSIGFDGPTPSVAMAVSFSPMPAAALKQMWPPFIAGGARRWVLQRVHGGTITGGKIEAAIPAGILWTGKRERMPDDAFRMEFQMKDVSFSTIGTVPTITRASGNGSLVGSTFGLDMQSGEVTTPSGRKATIANGIFAIPDLVPRYPDARVELHVAGDAVALGEIANSEPFRGLSRRDIDPLAFSGAAQANLSATWPLRPGITEADIAWRVKVDVEDFSSSKPIEGHTVKDGKVTIVVDRDEASIKGQALIDGVAAAVNMLEPINKGAASSDGRRAIRLVLDKAARERLGKGLEEIIAGTVTASVSDLPGPQPGHRYDIDLSRARIVLAFLGWSKGVGVPARLTFDLIPSGSNYKLEKLNVSGTGFVMTGQAVLDKDYGIVSGDIDRLSLRRGDNISLALKRDKSVYTITARGKSFDLRGLIAQVRSPDEFRSTAPDLTLDAKIDNVIGYNNETLGNASLLIRAHAGTVEQFELKGSLGDTPLTVSYVDDERGSSINMLSTDAGRVFRFIDFYARAVGGQIRISGQSIGPKGPMSGVFDVTDFAVLNEPAMQNVAARPAQSQSANAAEFDPRRVPFDRMLINFTKRDSLLVVDDALLRGPVLGATFAGSLDFATSRLAFAGTYIPAYAFNNLFGRVPLLGIILGGGSREGLFGVTFKLDGSLSAPRVTVNALSAITPGIFRKIFEFQQSGPQRYPRQPIYPNAPMQ